MGHAGSKTLTTSRRQLLFGARPLVMGILNLTPDSFSDGGRYPTTGAVIERIRQMVEEGVDIIDVGGESTRPGSARVSEAEEIARVLPAVEAAAGMTGLPVSIDTTKSAVAKAALEAGAEIVNDISGLRFDPALADAVAAAGAGLVLMHSRGEFETMHSLEPVADIEKEVKEGLEAALGKACAAGVERASIALDVGIGFGKSAEQNLGLIAGLHRICSEFEGMPMLVGASRKSFIGKILGGIPAEARLYGSLTVHAVAAWNGADILRTHDVRATREMAETVGALRNGTSR
jgi:dihydropteroate synthase